MASVQNVTNPAGSPNLQNASESPIGQSVPEPRIVRSNPFALPVLLCGLASTALTLVAIYILDRVAPDFNIMGLYADGILPAGALIVGIVASSGYGIASWIGGLKISKKLLWLILALQACAYFAAQYIEFKGLNLVHRDDNTPVGFFEYYDFAARSFAWQEHDGKAGEPLGAFGYFFRALELIGFAAGGLIVPAIMRKNPYCDRCFHYMRKKELGYVPASIKLTKVSKTDQAANDAQIAALQKAIDAGKARVESLQTLAAASKVDTFGAEMAVLKSEKKATLALPMRYLLELIHCPSCRAGHMKTALLEGQANQVHRTEITKTNLSEDFVQLIRNQ